VNQKRTFYTILILLALSGLVTAVLRHLATGTPFLPGKEESVWLVEARVDFTATGGPVSASLSLPAMQLPGFELFEEQAASPGYGFAILTDVGNRRAEWHKRDAQGEQSLYYSAQLVETNGDGADDSEEQLAGEDHSFYWEAAQELAAKQVLDQAREKSSSAESFTRELIKALNSSSSQNTALLRSGTESQGELLMHLLSRADIATRSVMGLYLEDARRR
jgi:hypothetical protein